MVESQEKRRLRSMGEPAGHHSGIGSADKAMTKRPKPMMEKGHSVIGYMCLTDFECELGMACGGNTVYPSERNLRKHRKCVPECGIAKVEVIGLEIIQEADFSAYDECVSTGRAPND